MKHYKYTFIAFFALVVLGTPWILSNFPAGTHFVDNIFARANKTYSNYSAAFFRDGVTVSQLHQKYNTALGDNVSNKQKVNILLVPGHEPGFGGAEFGKIKERDVAVDLAENLKDLLNSNPHFNVMVTRDKVSWNPVLQKYFSDNWNSIISFVDQSKDQMVHLIHSGSIKKLQDNISHNTAPTNVALRLFGINKWNNENHTDIAIHIHFNDNARFNTLVPGAYSGFAIYVPERQYSNSTTTKAIAEKVFKRLSKYNAVSNFPEEEVGVVEDQDLIAIGSNNTLDAPSMLIEYGYIYEPQFNDPVTRSAILKDLAFQTYLGIQDFFDSENKASIAYDTLMLPHDWKNNIDKTSINKDEILALQSALMDTGFYPPQNKTKNECPRSGKFGSCTINALQRFQEKYSIKNEANIVGEQTQKILNNLYSIKIQ